MRISLSVTSIFICWICCGISASAFALPRTKEYRGSGEVISSKNGMAAAEPTCEELKTMWRFSKRQSRAAEITNEIPMYRDPFSDNVWEPYYATSRSMGGARMGKYRARPIYGRMVHKPPILRIEDADEKNKAFEEVVRLYGVQRQNEPRRRLTTFRLSGGGHLPSLGFPPQTGSFQHLKELIKTERARELQEQRMAEEEVAKTAALKELGRNGNHRGGSYRDVNYNYDVDDSVDEQNNYMGGGRGGIITFPDLLTSGIAPSRSDRPDIGEGRFIQDYSYTRGRSRPHSSALFDTSSSFNNGFNGYLL